MPNPGGGVFNVAFKNSLFSRTCNEGTGCICQRELMRRKHCKLLRNHSSRAHGLRAAGTAIVIAVNWNCYALSSLHSVVLQWNTIGVCKHCLEQQFPLLHKKREFLSFPFPACYIRDEELTHSPFMHTQPEQKFN